MEINLLDFIFWAIGIWVLGKILGPDNTEELGGIVVGCPVFILYTFIWIFFFCIIDHDVYDIGVWIYENVRIEF